MLLIQAKSGIPPDGSSTFVEFSGFQKEIGLQLSSLEICVYELSIKVVYSDKHSL